MRDSSGNILFIILIAVALFAALIYAVSKTTQGTGDGGAREASLTDSAVVQQYAATLRGATSRMMVHGIHLDQLEFNPPSDFGNLTSVDNGVFSYDGGTVIYQGAPRGIIDPAGGNLTGEWVFTLNFEVENVGTSSPGSLDGNDLMAFLVGVKQSVCEIINSKLGVVISPFPTVVGAAYSTDMITNIDNYYKDNNYVFPATEVVIGAGAGDSALSGKSEGCYYESTNNNYVYFVVISDR